MGAILVGLALRLGGLSHDLDQGYVYHPDTPKQIAATQMFLRGIYKYETGILDYDAYPYLNSRIVQFVYATICRSSIDWLGLPTLLPGAGDSFGAEDCFLFWLTRLVNVFFATCTIALAWYMGKLICGRKCGLLAAWLVAVSPIEVATCHYAMSDSTAAFFAVASVLLTVLAVKKQRLPLMIAATATITAGFAAKYHVAAMAPSLALGYAYLACRRPFRLWTIAFTTLGCLLAAWLTLAIAVPTFSDSPVAYFQLIHQFMAYTSNFALSQDMASQPIWQRLLVGLRWNIPNFIFNITWIGFAAALLTLIVPAISRGRRILVWIIASAPLFYILVGLTSKPSSQVGYHTIVTPIIAMLAAFFLVRVTEIGARRARTISACLALVAIAGICLPLARRSIEQLAYFNLRDTRRLVWEWVQQQCPPTYEIAAAHYTTIVPPPLVDPAIREGVVLLSATVRPYPPPDVCVFTNSLRLGDHALELFRNPDIDIFLHSSKHLTGTNYAWQPLLPLPHWQASIPILGDVINPVVDRRTSVISTRYPVNSLFFTERTDLPLTLAFQAGPASTRVKGHVAGQEINLTLEPHEQYQTTIMSPRRVWWSSSESVAIYQIALRMPYGIASISLNCATATAALPLAQPPLDFFEAAPPLAIELEHYPDWKGHPLFLPPGRYWLSEPLPADLSIIATATGHALISGTSAVTTQPDPRAFEVDEGCGMLVIRSSDPEKPFDGRVLNLRGMPRPAGQ